MTIFDSVEAIGYVEACRRKNCSFSARYYRMRAGNGRKGKGWVVYKEDHFVPDLNIKIVEQKIE